MLLLLKHAAFFSGWTLLTRLVKQIWLVMLMVFAIGWSSVSVASATTMHLVMSSEQMSSHCLDMVKASTSHAMHESAHNSDQDLTQADCFPDMPQHSQDCLDCSTMACQSQMSGLQISAPELTVFDHHSLKNPPPNLSCQTPCRLLAGNPAPTQNLILNIQFFIN